MHYNGTSGKPEKVFASAESIAIKLWQLLDDIDTADDLAKDNDKLYRNLVRRAHRERFKYASTDGHSLELHTK